MSLVKQVEDALRRACGAQGEAAMHMLLELAAGISDDDGEAVMDSHPELRATYGARVTAIYQQYIFDYEDLAIKKLEDSHIDKILSFKKASNFFGKSAYERSNEIYDYFSFDNVVRFVVIGCGKLPFTAFHAHENTQNCEIIAVDIMDDAVDSVSDLAKRFGMHRLKSKKSAGEAFDFNGADVVYVANMVFPKADVLKRIATTASRDVRVVLRDPYSIGRLWSDRGSDALHPYFEVTGYGAGAAYKSRHVYLQRI